MIRWYRVAHLGRRGFLRLPNCGDASLFHIQSTLRHWLYRFGHRVQDLLLRLLLGRVLLPRVVAEAFRLLLLSDAAQQPKLRLLLNLVPGYASLWRRANRRLVFGLGRPFATRSNLRLTVDLQISVFI